VDDSVQVLDQQFARDPSNCGESRDEGIRIAFAGPLGCRVSIDESLNHDLVEVVWRMR